MLDNEPLQLDPDIMFRAVGEEGVVVDQRNFSVLVINATALRVLELLRQGLSAAAISAQLAEEFDGEPHRISADVDKFLDELRQRRVAN